MGGGALANNACFFGGWVIHSFNQPCQKQCSLKMVLYLIFKLAFDCEREWHPCDTEKQVMQLLYYSVLQAINSF